ncbi:MAG: glutathione peroxidase, partial [Pseudomonadota bacterium]
MQDLADNPGYRLGRAMTRRALLGAGALLGLASFCAGHARADSPAQSLGFTFPSIDGGTLALGDWLGRPVLVVNTASRCGFTRQYEALQALYDRYRADGLIVLAIPSNDFRQELATEAEVREFCEVTFGLDLPMTEITAVRGRDAHPFYQWLAAE